MAFPLRVVRVSIVIAVFAVALMRLGDDALAVADSEQPVLFGPIGVGAGEAVRVNVYGLSRRSDVPWEFAVRVFNRRGEIAQQRRLRVAPGAIGSFDVNVGNPDEFPVERLGRRTLRAEIVGVNPQPDPPGTYAATLEVYNQLTGHTSILLGGPDTLPALQP
jgi:hypothetical protein